MTAAAALTARLRDWSTRQRMMAAAALGVAMTLAQAPVGFWWILAFALPLLVSLHQGAEAPRRAAWIGWAAGTGYFASGLYWIAEAFLVDIARHGWMAPFAMALMAGGLALFWALPFWIGARFGRGPLARALLLIAAWTLAEYARAHVFTGFPWALVGYAWVETPVAQLAALIGPHGLGLFTLLCFGMLAFVARSRSGAVILGAAIAALVCVWVWGGLRLSGPVTMRDDGFTVRLVQPNAPQHEKWQPDRIPEFFARQREFTRVEPRPPLVVWPETAVPYLIGDDAEARKVIAAVSGTSQVILGARRVEQATSGPDAWFNALFVLSARGDVVATYDKHHLVPFGEYMPVQSVFNALGLSGMTGSSFSAGPGPSTVAPDGIPPFLAQICYEAIFPHELSVGSRPEWILQITNDAWFGSSAGPHQHFAQARMRAIEQGLPVARAANTGISAMIGPRGEILKTQPLLTAGYIDAGLPAARAPTLYAGTGDLPAFLVALVVFALTVRTRR